MLHRLVKHDGKNFFRISSHPLKLCKSKKRTKKKGNFYIKSKFALAELVLPEPKFEKESFWLRLTRSTLDISSTVLKTNIVFEAFLLSFRFVFCAEMEKKFYLQTLVFCMW